MMFLMSFFMWTYLDESDHDTTFFRHRNGESCGKSCNGDGFVFNLLTVDGFTETA